MINNEIIYLGLFERVVKIKAVQRINKLALVCKIRYTRGYLLIKLLGKLLAGAVILIFAEGDRFLVFPCRIGQYRRQENECKQSRNSEESTVKRTEAKGFYG